MPHTPGIDVTVGKTKIVHPARPAPLRLQDEKFEACENGTKVCLTLEEAKKIPANKQEIGRYVGEINAVLNYYQAIE